MSNLKTAAQQALEALELGYDSAKAEADQYHAAMAGYRPQRHAEMDAEVQKIAAAITALRVALAEPQSTHSTECYQWHHKCAVAEVQRLRAEMEEIDSDGWRCGVYKMPDLPLAEPVQEPVAWMYHGIRHDGTPHDRPSLIWRPKYMDAMSAEKGAKAIPLYADPPQHKAALAELVVEPVAWIQPDHLQKARVAPFLCRVEPTQRCSDFVALYTAPPPSASR